MSAHPTGVAGRAIAAAALLVALAAPAAAGMPEAIKALAAGDFPAAARELRPIAEGGDVRAQLLLARTYRDPRNAERNPAEAYAWFLRAADAGNAEARHWVGLMQHVGEGTEKDVARAIASLREAADGGHLPALGMLASIHWNGSGVDKNPTEAVRWARLGAQRNERVSQSILGLAHLLGEGGVPRNAGEFVLWTRRAAQQGDRNSQAALGRAFIDGLGVPQDYVQAHLWLNLAAARGHGSAGKQRDELAAKMTPDQVAEAQKLARTWRPTGQPAVAAKPAPAGGATQRAGMGSGFVVDAAGHVLTNHQVVRECTEVRIPAAGETVRVAAVDERNDLALLVSAIGAERLPVFRQGPPPRLGEPVIVAGYPLGQVLAASLNVTTGAVSALAGPGNNAALLQITAPVQAGNSGGPVLDQQGRVVGVVVSKLNALRVAAITGDVPQNVNFAVNGAVVRAFLEANGVQIDDPFIAPGTASTPDVADQAKRYTLAVECWR